MRTATVSNSLTGSGGSVGGDVRKREEAPSKTYSDEIFSQKATRQSV